MTEQQQNAIKQHFQLHTLNIFHFCIITAGSNEHIRLPKTNNHTSLKRAQAISASIDLHLKETDLFCASFLSSYCVLAYL